MEGTGEILFRNGCFVDPSAGTAPAGEALLARDGRIVHVGAEAACRARAAPDAAEIDLGGRTALPGFVDAHVHLQGLGQSLEQCDLSGTADRREAVERIAAFARKHADSPWVRARGYQLNAWADPAYPTARQLDEAVCDRPCLAVAFDGHSVWLNSAAMSAAGLARGAADPAGGAVVRDGKGRPTGYLLEAAAGIAWRAVPEETDADRARHFRAGIEEMVRRGHTAAHVPLGADAAAMVQLIRGLYAPGRCPLRIYGFAAFEALDEVAGAAADADAPDRVQLAGVKCFLDGSLGSRTAWMFEPYGDDPAWCGIRTMPPAELRRRIAAANAAGVPLICHAIGDRACAEALWAFRDAGDAVAGNRVEHAQHLRPDELELFARAGVAASVQPGHLATDWRPTDRLMGSRRARWAFAFRSLLDRGAVLAAGSDAPVVPPDLAASLRAAVTRTDAAGRPEGGWHAEECLTPRQWARAATHGAWESIGRGDLVGRLAPGMACDLSIVSGNFLAAGPANLPDWHVDATVVAGEMVRCTWH